MIANATHRRRALLRNVLHFHADRIMPALGIRNAVGVALPLLLGIHYRALEAGLAASIGALLVAYSDNQTPYLQRAPRMLAAGVLSSLAVLVALSSATNPILAVIVSGMAAFLAGLVVCMGAAVGEVAADVLVALLIFATKKLSIQMSMETALLVLAGGLLQVVLSLALWPLNRYGPERRVLGNLYHELSRIARNPTNLAESPAATYHSNEVHNYFATLDWARSAESERCRALLSQAERIRVSLLTLIRMSAQSTNKTINNSLPIIANVLDAVGDSLHGTAIPPQIHDTLRSLDAAFVPGDVDTQMTLQLDALGGQLRASVDLSRRTMPVAFRLPRSADEPSIAAKARSIFISLLVNLNLRSAAFRHALRLSACVVIGDALARSFSIPRSYWVPMTIVIVLKPDYSTTFARGIARLGGTLIGLLLATALFALLSPGIAMQVIIISAMTIRAAQLRPRQLRHLRDSRHRINCVHARAIRRATRRGDGGTGNEYSNWRMHRAACLLGLADVGTSSD
ncbi:MAG: FUSC family protein [Phycisphaerae bacterium]|nr:FUSC family protein [Phycisphaerae bacterium]